MKVINYFKNRKPITKVLIAIATVLIVYFLFSYLSRFFYKIFFIIVIISIVIVIISIVSLPLYFFPRWVLRKIKQKKYGALLCIFSCISCFILADYIWENEIFGIGYKEPVFIFGESRKYMRYDEAPVHTYSYYILIENTPKDTTELKRLMIYHYLDITSAVCSLQANSDLKGIYCTFLKSTPSTRKRFSLSEDEIRKHSGTYLHGGGRNSFGWHNESTYVGSMYVRRCDENNTKFNAYLNLHVGTPHYLFKEGRINESEYVLLEECKLRFSNRFIRNIELTKYFINISAIR